MSIERLNELMPPGPTPRYYPPSLFRASPTQPRRRVKPAKVEEMRASIEQAGQQQAILARPNPEHTEGDGQPPLEIVFGHQRWEAIGGLESGPGVLANVRELTDQQVKQIQMIENMDREDLHPYDEAAGLQRLLRSEQNADGFASVDELAAWLRKSRRWVYQRLSLTRLCEKARDAFLDDKINASVAALLARMEDQEQQLEATEKILAGWGGDPYSFRAAAKLLQDEFMLNLSNAPFDIQATFEIAGPCGQCPKRSGANPDLFAEISSGDMCQDRGCFGAKARETIERKLASAEAAGHQVMRGSEALRLMPNYSAPPNGYYLLAETCPKLTDSKKPLSEIFGAKARGAVTLLHPNSETVITIVPEADVRKVLKAKGLLRQETQAPTDVAPKSSVGTQGNQGTKARPRTQHELTHATRSLTAEKFSLAAGTMFRDHLRQLDAMPIELARIVAFQRVNELNEPAMQLVFALQGWPFDQEYDEEDQLATKLDELVAAGSSGTLGELLVHAAFAENLATYWSVENLFDEEDDTCYAANEIAALFGLKDQLKPLYDQFAAEAAIEVEAEEDKRLGRIKPKDATDAFVEAHAPASGKTAAKKSSVKYRKQDTGETWSGRGLQPAWLKAAISAGDRLEDFEVTA
ncbi:ParB/RepB/Spo0J family partition protein [Roseateles sp.]|uniref:ParB/RepB/Spo0J family partition protein n=1 Tax=Roseateles sp. TaxID=1971397 RepID=UPI002F3FC654